MTPPVTVDEIASAFRAAKVKREQFLEQRGWRLDANFPDQIWRWCKVIRGREIAMSAGSAFAMERNQS